MAKQQSRKAKAVFDGLGDRMTCLETMVGKLHLDIKQILSELAHERSLPSTQTMQELVGERILRTMLQLAMLNEFPTITKEKRAEIIIHAAEKAIEEYVSGRENDNFCQESDKFLKSILTGENRVISDKGAIRTDVAARTEPLLSIEAQINSLLGRLENAATVKDSHASDAPCRTRKETRRRRR